MRKWTTRVVIAALLCLTPQPFLSAGAAVPALTDAQVVEATTLANAIDQSVRAVDCSAPPATFAAAILQAAGTAELSVIDKALSLVSARSGLCSAAIAAISKARENVQLAMAGAKDGATGATRPGAGAPFSSGGFGVTGGGGGSGYTRG